MKSEKDKLKGMYIQLYSLVEIIDLIRGHSQNTKKNLGAKALSARLAKALKPLDKNANHKLMQWHRACSKIRKD